MDEEPAGASALSALRAGGWLAPRALVTLEVAKGEALAAPEGFATLDERRYGRARIVILRHEEPT